MRRIILHILRDPLYLARGRGGCRRARPRRLRRALDGDRLAPGPSGLPPRRRSNVTLEESDSETDTEYDMW